MIVYSLLVVCALHTFIVVISIHPIIGEKFQPNSNLESVELNKLKSVMELKGLQGTISYQNFPIPPKFMIEMYQQQTREDADHEGNTLPVRCIIGKMKREALTFNLTSLSGESFFRAEMHLFRKKSGQGKLPRMKFFVSSPRRAPNGNGGGRKMGTGDSYPLPTGRGWKIVDVTNIIRSRYRKWDTFGFGLEGLIPEFGSGRQIYHGLPLDEHIRVAVKPFLVFYSKNLANESQTIQTTEFKTVAKSSLPDTNTLKNSEWNSILDKDTTMEGYNRQELRSTSQQTFVKRSVVDHEIDNRILPLHSTKHRSRKTSTRNRLKKPATLQSLNEIDYSNSFQSEEPNLGECSLVGKRIPLAEFSWAEAILAPASVPVNYCHGSCTNVDLNQYYMGESSLQHCIDDNWRQLDEKRNSIVGCCRASSFRRLSVLYVDSYESIVLESFGKMSIGSCSCS